VAKVTNAEKLRNRKEMGGTGEKDGHWVIPEMDICTGHILQRKPLLREPLRRKSGGPSKLRVNKPPHSKMAGRDWRMSAT
jgi:hypothetical protein